MATELTMPSTAVSDTKERLQQIVEEYTAAAKKALEIRLAATDLEPLDFARMKVVVTDDHTAEVAASFARSCEQYKQTVDRVFESPTGFFFKVHRWLTGTRGELTRPADDVILHNKQQTASYLRRREQERRELQAKLQREADERARLEREQLKREQEEKQADAMPWDIPESATASVPVAVSAPRVVIPDTPAPAGIKEKRKPWTYEVFDMVAFLKAAVEDKTLLEYIDQDSFLNKKMMKAKAQQMGADLEKRFPGVRGVRETRVEF